MYLVICFEVANMLGNANGTYNNSTRIAHWLTKCQLAM